MIASPIVPALISQVAYRTAEVLGRKMFYREAGDPAAPAIVLLHGFPSSSHMFRDLIPLLAGRFRVIAPDYIGFGQSEAPASGDFAYTFDNLTRHVEGLLEALGVSRAVFYLHDFGGPVGFRIAAAHPEKVAGLVVQNANAYMEGVSEAALGILGPIGQHRDAESETAARALLSADMTRFQYLAGARNPEAISPDTWTLDQAWLDRPGTDVTQLDLFENYMSNIAAYESWHDAFRINQFPTLIVWGRGDPFFLPAGAEAFLRDLSEAKLVWLDSGHFALEENVALVAAEILAAFAPV